MPCFSFLFGRRVDSRRRGSIEVDEGKCIIVNHEIFKLLWAYYKYSYNINIPPSFDYEFDDDREKAKTADADVEEEEDDKISSLPDEILCIILSNFSTKESVRTSILSKRWRYVWTSVPNLLIYDHELFDREKLVFDDDNCFVNFINRAFLLHKASCIQKFHLSCTYEIDPAIVSALINTVIHRNVEEIVLKVYQTDVELSPSFFTCKKLVVLELGFDFFVNVPESVSFPNLKILILCFVPHFDDGSVKNLLSGCPVLEELDISECHNVRNLCIQSPKLKKLKVEYDYDTYERCKLVIESPNLQYLDLIDCVTEDVTVTFQPSLVEVHISVNETYLRHEIPDEINCDKFIKLLQSISNTKHLEVAHVPMDSTTLPVSDFPNLPVFLNLMCLKVVVSDSNWDILPFLLEFSPHLHTCFIDKMEHNYLPCECKWKSPYTIPKCLLLSLEEIVITGFEACNNEIEMVEYFLKNGRVLKKMLIESIKLRPEENSNVSEEKSNVRKKLLEFPKKLLEFPKASSTCIFKIKYKSRVLNSFSAS